ncbi:MAG: polysaccharide pyruvyl transferase family protein [Clostridia bacterium]|nr:polysaccharide pyruvyl transferase family protein [Clostridia bacterium]
MNILICGFIGGGNCGDEAICDRLIAAIRERGDAVTILSLSPVESEALHGIPALPRRSPAVLKAIWRCDLLILGGGTLLQTQTSRRSAVCYLSLAALAAAMGRPWVLIGGIDPLSGGVCRYAKAILPTAQAFFLRDWDSLRRARDLAPTVPRFYLPDSALLPLGKGVDDREKPRFPYVVICPKAGVRGKTVAPVVRSAKRRGLRLVFLAMSREDEGICAAQSAKFGGVFVSVMSTHTPAAHRVKAETILPDLPPHSAHRYFCALPCEIACRLIEGAEEVYSARLHGLIFAKKAGVRAHILPDGTGQWKFVGI